MMGDIELLRDSLESRDAEPWFIAYSLLRIVGRLLGYDFQGEHPHTPVYFQTVNQWVTTEILMGGDTMADYYEQKNAVVVQHRVVEQLIGQGMTRFQVGIVMNTTEFEIKKRSSPAHNTLQPSIRT